MQAKLFLRDGTEIEINDAINYIDRIELWAGGKRYHLMSHNRITSRFDLYGESQLHVLPRGPRQVEIS